MHERAPMLRFWAAGTVFHVSLRLLSLKVAGKWQRRLESRPSWSDWMKTAGADGLVFMMAAVSLALAASVIGPRSGFTAVRFLSQALFGEAVLLASVLAWLHAKGRLPARATAIGLVAAGLLAVYWEAYHREPAELRVSVHSLDLAGTDTSSARLRILHLTDIQADRIGEHEERAIREGLAQAPDLIVMTGDYVQPRLAPTRVSATADFKALLIRRGFRAPLGVYAVRGDVDTDWPWCSKGPACGGSPESPSA